MLSKEKIQQTEVETKQEVPWLTPAEMRAWLAFWSTAHLVDKALDNDLQTESGLSHNDYHILAMLSKAPNRQLRMTELADITFGSRSRITYQITQLEKAGLVRREDCVTDKRGAVTVLTPQGYEILRSAAPGHLASIRRIFFDQLTPEQVNILGDALQSIIGGLGGLELLGVVLQRELRDEQDVLL